MQVHRLDLNSVAAWDDFVIHSPGASFFHLATWRKVIERAFGHRTHYLYAEESGKVVGVLPLAEIKSILFGHTLTSLPFCVYGGIVAESALAEAALRKAACELAEKQKVGALELRNIQDSDSGWIKKDLYYTFRKEISPDSDINLKAVPNRQRAMIRKGINGGLTSEETRDTLRLYRVYAESLRNLGTPVFSRKYLNILLDEFGENCRILMIRDGSEDVAGVMSFYFRDQVLPYYGGSVARARELKGCNHFMYWEVIRRSADEGVRIFDFGRSKSGTGPFSFKKNWGFEPERLHYEYYLVKSAQMPDLNPNSPKYRTFVEAWKKLPQGIANGLGPLLAKSLG